MTMATMFFMPSSPVFLLSQDREEEARKALQWLRGSSYNIEREIKEESRKFTRLSRIDGCNFCSLNEIVLIDER